MLSPIVREYRDTDWPKMVKFYKKFYGENYIFTNKSFFYWNFSSPLVPTNRSGQRLLVLDDNIIGIMGALAWPLQVGGEKILGEYNINLFVDPKYRGSNLGQKLLESVISEYRHSMSNGYAEKTISIYRRLGTVFNWNMTRLIKVIEPDGTAEMMTQSPNYIAMSKENQRDAKSLIKKSMINYNFSKKLILEEVGRFDQNWDKAWDTIRISYGFTTWRESSFLNWRYVDYPFPLYKCYIAKKDNRITGVIVVRTESSIYGKIGRIVDLVSINNEIGELLSGIIDLAIRNKLLWIDYICAGQINCDIAEKYGFVNMSNSNGATLLPMDFYPLRYRDTIKALALFLDSKDSGCDEFRNKEYYIVKGDGDQDRAN